MAVQTYRQLIAWQRAMDFAEEVYRATRSFPKEELYGVTSPLRRAVISIPSNVAEGQDRQSTGEFRQFLGNARGSLLEVESQILLAERFHYLTSDAAKALLARSAEVGRVLNGLMGALQQSRRKETDH